METTRPGCVHIKSMSQKKMLNQATLVILAMCEAEIGKIMV
jgi:hypothetical protein